MPKIEVSSFDGGEIQGIVSNKLADGQAQVAINCDLTQGDLRPLFAPLAVKRIQRTGDIRSAFLLPDPSGGAPRWMHWLERVDVVMSPTADSGSRFFWTDGTLPRKSNFVSATQATELTWPTTSYSLGIPQPDQPLTAQIVGDGTGEVKNTVSYVYEFITGWGEMSKRSEPTAAFEVEDGQYVTLSNFRVPAGDYNIVGFRVYRLAEGQSGAEYQLVPAPEMIDSSTTGGHIPIAVSTVTDQTSGENNIIPGDLLEDEIISHYFDAPPADLQGLILLSNGVMAGFRENEVYLSEPGYPFAFPSRYVAVTDHKIVALGHYDNVLAVATEGAPYLIDGSDPASKSPPTKLPFSQACLSRRGLASCGSFVLFPTMDGMFSIGASGMRIISQPARTSKQWMAMNPSSLIGFFVGGRYIGFFEGTGDGFCIDLRGQAPVWTSLSLGLPIYGGTVDPLTGLYLLLKDGADYWAYSWEGDTSTRLTVRHRSKGFYVSGPIAFSDAKVLGAVNTTFRAYADGALYHQQVVNSDTSFRLPAGAGYEWELEIEGQDNIEAITIATSTQEL